VLSVPLVYRAALLSICTVPCLTSHTRGRRTGPEARTTSFRERMLQKGRKKAVSSRKMLCQTIEICLRTSSRSSTIVFVLLVSAQILISLPPLWIIVTRARHRKRYNVVGKIIACRRPCESLEGRRVDQFLRTSDDFAVYDRLPLSVYISYAREKYRVWFDMTPSTAS